MMATSFRFVARSCPACLSSRTSSQSIAASPARRFITQKHQRRHSSTKQPPAPPNQGSPSIPAGSEGPVKSVGSRSKTSTEKRAGAESRLSKRKTKDKAAVGSPPPSDTSPKVPSVPDTRYLQPKGEFSTATYAISC